MYKIKQVPEDFIVKEISNKQFKDKGKFFYFLLKKKNRNTLDVVKEISRRLNIKERQIGFAGNKDKQAITEQVLSVLYQYKNKVLQMDVKECNITPLGFGNEPISLGDLKGNYFEIVVRNVDKKFKSKTITHIHNYFDTQRFGTNNKDIGKFLIKKRFKEAAQLIKDKKVDDYLQKYPNDAVGALKQISIRMLRFYIHAYQSWLWNETLTMFLGQADSNSEIPLVGFGTELDDGKLDEIIRRLMSKEQITTKDFIIRAIPEISVEGGMRKAIVDVNNLVMGQPELDELNRGQMKIKLSFSLSKGSYATMVVKSLFIISNDL